VLQIKNNRGKTQPTIRINPKNETLESYRSKAVGTRTLNFGVQIATGGAI